MIFASFLFVREESFLHGMFLSFLFHPLSGLISKLSKYILQ